MATAKTNTTASALRRVMPDDSLSIMDMLMLCLRHWPWFVLSLTLIMGGAVIYLLCTSPVYTRSMSILVKSQNASNEAKMFDVLGMSDAVSDISDEVVAIHSPAVVYDMVKRLHLDIDYKRPGLFRNTTLYGSSLPVEVTFDGLHDNETASFKLTMQKDGNIKLSDFKYNSKEIDSIYSVKFDKSRKMPFGTMTVKSTPTYQKGSEFEILVTRISYNTAAEIYGEKLSAALQQGARNIIVISCNDVNTSRAENILSTVSNIYNENWVKNRNQVSVSTNEFIKERLAVIERELGDVEGDIAAYKSSRGMLSVEQAAGQAIGKEAASDAERQAINNQLYMIRYVRNYVSDPSHAKQLMPASTGIGNAAIEAQIADYNTRILERNNLVSNSSEQNPLVGDIDVNLGNLRSAIMKSLDNAQATLNAQLSSVQAVHGQALSQLSAAPQQQNHLLSFERQQKVKESLYLFLLQKREENELSQAFTAYNTRLIASPGGSGDPIFPDQNRILLMAFAIALAIPAAFFILREISNSKVRGRKDLENLTIPYVGELPMWKPKKGEETTEDGYRIVVRQHKRDITNEAFRVVRTNLEFMTNEEKQCKIIMLTSFNPGSGKTFITANMGASFAIRGSRVICIDLDLRRGSLSEFAGKPKHGFTDYLSGKADEYRSLIVHQQLNEPKEGENVTPQLLDFLPMGKIPPNPTELLYSPKLKPMLDELRQQYDYIFVDCPPVEIVADATIISHEADVTLFVVRAGLLERSMLPELQKNYDEKKYNNMAMILNGTDAEHHYGYHRYGYGYGRYGYGKRYGYGYYGHDSKKKK